MAIQQQGDTGTVQRIEEGRRNARVVLNPDTGAEVIGHYVAGQASGLVATAAAGAEVFQFRNSHASNLVIIERIVICMAVGTAITVAQEMYWDLIRSTAWTVAGTGGTALVPTRRRTSLNASTMAAGDIRIATTAALGAGTKTLDANGAMSSGPGPASNAIGSSSPVEYVPEDDVRYPLMVLAQNEGFSLRNGVALATGAGRFHVRVLWREVSSY